MPGVVPVEVGNISEIKKVNRAYGSPNTGWPLTGNNFCGCSETAFCGAGGFYGPGSLLKEVTWGFSRMGICHANIAGSHKIKPWVTGTRHLPEMLCSNLGSARKELMHKMIFPLSYFVRYFSQILL